MLSNLPLPLLVTGVSGVAGYNALFHFQHAHPGHVVGIRPTATYRLKGPGIVAVDTEDEAALGELFRRHRFRSVLNTTGNCALKACELSPDLAYRTNVLSARNIARHARDGDARLVHLSSDLVYSGNGAGGYVETDSVDPVTVYGKTMAEAESVVFDLCPDAAVLRISLPMGPSFNGHAGAIDWIDSRFRNGRPATLYYDEVRSSTYCDDLSHVFDYFLRHRAAGLFHCGGPRPLALFQIAQVINRAGGYAASLLHGCPRRDAGPMPPRAGNVSMNSEKLYQLMGECPFRPWPLGDDLVPDDRGWHQERPEGWSGGRRLIEGWLYRYPGAASEGWLSAREAVAKLA